jgi:MFS family permease
MSHGSKWKAMVLLALGELLGMSVWFSASAVVPVLQRLWDLNDSMAAWLTQTVQLGFVAGTLLSAAFNLPDIMSTRHFLTICAFGAALSNASLSLFVQGPAAAFAFRFATGIFLAGVYPPAMKIMATWFRKGRGTAIGVLIGALTLGKAFPYLLNVLGPENWRNILLLDSLLAALGGLIILFFVGDGPYAAPIARFDMGQIGKVFRNRGVRLANFGYFGHMWELYAMWTWTPVMIRASLAAQGGNPHLAEFAAFLTIGSGAAGCVIAGIAADRVGRTLVASAAMIVSGAFCILIGLFYEADPMWLLLILTIWGASVVADSAQFSTCVTELGNPRYLGTALTLQTCLGFLLTTVSIQLIPFLVSQAGWRYAFIALSPGPIFGVLAMLRLRRLPEAVRLAEGNR